MFLFSIHNGKNNSSNQELNDICEKYYSDIHHYCTTRLDISYAENITNEVFLIFCKKWHTLENKNYNVWLYKTANNLLKNYYKKQKQKIEKEIYIDDSVVEILSYEQDFDNISEYEIEEYKNKILGNLLENDWQLFIMKYIDKLSSVEISEKLSISENAVNQRVFRIREKIKSEASKISNKI